MPQLTPAEIASLRTHPHILRKHFLYVFQPETLLATTVNGDVGRVQTIPTDAADCSAALRGMTLWVGSTAGAHDKGKIRIRANGAGANLYASEHEIDLEDGDHLTVLDNYELWAVNHQIETDGTIYKDWDGVHPGGQITYPGSNIAYQPVPVMGPHSIQWLGEDHHYDWSRSWAVAPGAAVVGYAATFPGGTPANSVASDGTVTWDTAGARWVRMAATDSNGITCTTGKRLYATLDPTWRDANGLYVGFGASPRTGSTDNGGFSMQFTVHVDAPESAFPDGALVIWFFDEGTQGDIGGNWPHRTHIRFIGHIRAASTHKEPETGHVTFTAETFQAQMKVLPCFANFLEDEAAPTVWTEAASLTIQRAATLHMRWNSSLLEMADVLFVPDADTSIGEHVFPEGFLYDQLNGLASKDYLYRIGCDYHSTVFFNKDPQFQTAAERAAIATIMDLEAGDWSGEVDFPERLQPETSYVMASGVAYAAGVVTPLFSEAPGPVPLERGKKDKSLSSLICTDQVALNALSGLALGHSNCRLPDVPISPRGQYYGLDHLFPMEFVGLPFQGTAIPDGTKRDMDLTGELFLPRRSKLEIIPDEHGAPSHASVGVNLELVTDGPPGQTLTYPTEPPDPPSPGEREGGGGYLPSQPSLPGPAQGDGHLLYLVDYDSGRVFRTRNARHPTPASVVYEDLGQVSANGLHWIALDSWDPKNCAMVCGPDGIWKTSNLNDAIPTWTQVFDMSVATGTPPFDAQDAIMVCSSICQEDYWACISQGGSPPRLLYWVSTADGGATWPTQTLITNNSSDVYLPPYPKMELSSHDANKAWVSYLTAVMAKYYVSKTINQGAAWTAIAIANWHSYWPSNPHHRFLDNAGDTHALIGAYDDIFLYSNDYEFPPPGDLVTTDLDWAEVHWLESYTWGTTKYWALIDDDQKFYISDDAETWTLQADLSGTDGVRFISGWPYMAQRFYAAQDGVTAPLLISDDRGLTWQEQTGNWNALVGPAGLNIDPVLYCIVPMWVE